MVKNPSAKAGDARDAGLIPGLGRSPGGGNGNPLQYSYLENPMYRGAWWATLHGVSKCWTRWNIAQSTGYHFLIFKLGLGSRLLTDLSQYGYACCGQLTWVKTSSLLCHILPTKLKNEPQTKFFHNLRTH